jgi:hypothetical protein
VVKADDHIRRLTRGVIGAGTHKLIMTHHHKAWLFVAVELII